MDDSLLAFDGHLRAGRVDRAKTLLAHLLERSRDDVEVRVATCRLDAAFGNLARAIEGLEVIVTEEPRHASAMGHLAGLVARAGDQGRALMLARRATERGARVPEAMLLLADDALRAEQPEEALSLFSTALSIDDGLSIAWFGKGQAHIALDEIARAEEAYVQGVTREPSNVDAWVTLIELELAAAAVDIARENLALALRTHPGDGRLTKLQARLAADLDPVEGALVRVRDAIYDGDIEAARDMLDVLVDKHGDDPRIVVPDAEIVLATDSRERIPELVHSLMRTARATPMFWPAKAALGRLLMREGPMFNLPLAVVQCEDAWRTSGEHPHAGLALVEAWAASGKRAYARALCTRIAATEGREGARAKAILEGRVTE
jgi:tetratricopeptide (TPR) repeat protein